MKEGEEGQTKGTGNIFNKIIAENCSNLKKEVHIWVQEATRTTNRHDQSRTSPQHIIVKTAQRTRKEY
jgi:hypothetical protein